MPAWPWTTIALMLLAAACADGADDTVTNETTDTLQPASVSSEAGRNARPSATDEAATSAVEIDPEWLEGNWVVEGESCRSDAGFSFSAENTYRTYGEDGSWSVEGDRVILAPAGFYEPGEPGMTPAAEEDQYVWTIAERQENRFVIISDDGTSYTMTRC